MSTEPQDTDDRLLKAACEALQRKPVASSNEAEADFRDAKKNIRKLVDLKNGPPSEKGIDKALFLYAVEKSLAHLTGYASLNFKHMCTLIELQAAVVAYEDSHRDLSDSRPENWLITSKPGEGKSHLVSCIAKAPGLRDKVNLVSFNMASMRTADDLIQALDEVRNVAITGKLPMLFLDEVDDKEGNFGLLLPLLWDGEIQVGIKRIRIGRAVIVAAGSKKYLVEPSETKLEDFKLEDFRSRLKFDVKIPPLTSEDQVCIAIAVLRQMYKDDKGSRVLSVPVSLLNFIYDIKFSYGVRSVRYLIDYLKTGHEKHDIKDGVLNISRLTVALKDEESVKKSGLLAHIKEGKSTAEAQAEGIVKDWKEAVRGAGGATAPIWCELFREVGVGAPSTWPEDRVEFYNAQLLGEMSGGEVYRFVGAGIDGVGVLYFFPDRGIWEHGRPVLRHIFFNLRTIASIFDRLKDDDEERYSVGHSMGKAFGDDFLRDGSLERFGLLEPEITDMRAKMETLIQKWCKFDISGGWGFWGSSGQEITVKNSFFVQMDKNDFEEGKIANGAAAPHCVIMRGYIAGVLESFSAKLGDNTKFEVGEAKCGIHDFKAKKDHTECVFTWQRETQSASPGEGNVPAT